MQIFCKKDNCMTDIKELINNVKGLLLKLLKAIWLTNISLHQVFRVFCSFNLTFRSICPLLHYLAVRNSVRYRAPLA